MQGNPHTRINMEAQDRMLNDEETEMLPSSERDSEPTGISSDTAVSHTEEEQADTVPLLPSTTGTEDGTVLSTSSRSSQGTPNNTSGNIGITVNGYANLIQEKFFWRNALTTNLNWVKLDDKDTDLLTSCAFPGFPRAVAPRPQRQPGLRPW